VGAAAIRNSWWRGSDLRYPAGAELGPTRLPDAIPRVGRASVGTTRRAAPERSTAGTARRAPRRTNLGSSNSIGATAADRPVRSNLGRRASASTTRTAAGTIVGPLGTRGAARAHVGLSRTGAGRVRAASRAFVGSA
jgi:hypothetical protein